MKKKICVVVLLVLSLFVTTNALALTLPEDTTEVYRVTYQVTERHFLTLENGIPPLAGEDLRIEVVDGRYVLHLENRCAEEPIRETWFLKREELLEPSWLAGDFKPYIEVVKVTSYNRNSRTGEEAGATEKTMFRLGISRGAVDMNVSL
ncbi:MAG: hypothetical protein J6M02_01760 [Clostridia bacterium]|nr:hypothetical protein [Clostridia bacterium]